MKQFFQKHRHFLWAGYLLFYMPWFMWLEDEVTTNFHDISIPLDRAIPFCEYFVIPYYMWFIFVAFTWLFLALTGKKDFYKFIGTLYSGMTLFLIISTLFPNGQTLRVSIDPNKNFCSWLVYRLHETDTPTNVFPSLHVYNSLVCCYALCKSKKFEPYKLLKGAVVVLTTLICLATVFLKQHSVIDVLGAGVMFLVFFPVFYLWLPQKEEAEEPVLKKKRV